MKKLISFVTLLISLTLFSSGPTFSFVSSGGGQSGSQGQEQAIQRQKSLEKREQKGQKRAESRREGEHVSEAEARRQAQSIVKGYHITAEASISSLFFPVISFLENQPDIEPFSSCRVLKHPRTIQDMGISYVHNGVTDTIAQQYWQSLAAQGAYFSCPACVQYARCLLLYGAVISQSTLCLINDLNFLQSLGFAHLQKKKEKGHEILEVHGVSLEDLSRLVRAILEKNLRSRKGYFFSLLPKPKDWSSAKVKFAGGPGGLNSFIVELPASSVRITLPSNCLYKGMSWFSAGDGQFGGLRLTLRIERGWSYSKVLEKLAQAQKYRDKVKEVTAFTDQLESRGMTLQALLVQKKALSLLLNGQTNFSPSSLLGR